MKPLLPLSRTCRFALAFAIAGGSLPAAAQQSAAVRGATVEGITEYSLPNGLRFLLFPDASKPTTTVNVTYFVGSRHEGYGETGMAHLFEHMLFKGSTNHPDIPQELTERGALPNGTTWFDRTNYFETFSATDANLEWALDLEADRMVRSLLREEDLRSEMTVVRNEFEAGENSPFGVLYQRVFSTAYLWHGYGRSTIGARSDIENVPIERLRAWYRKYYQPDNALLVVAGKFDEARALALIEQKFGAIPKPDRTGPNVIWPTYTREPAQDGERSVTLRRIGDLQVIMAAYHVPAGSHPDFAGVDVLAHVLGDEPSGRLYRNLVETKKAARVGAIGFQLAEPGLLLAFAEVRAGDPVEPAREALVQTIEDVVTNVPTAEEVERARAALVKGFELNLNDPNRVGLQLSEWASMGDWRLMFIHRDRLRRITPAEVGRVAASYLKRSNLTLGTFVPTTVPDRAEIPEAPAVEALVAGYRGDTARVAGEAFDPSPANIDARTRTTTLPNGVELVLLPKQTRGGSIALSLSLRFGTERSLSGRAIDGDLAGDMLMRGTRRKTRQQIQDEIDRLQARGGVSGTPTSASARFETTRENFAGVLRLVAEILREPAFDAKEYEELRQERLASLEEQRTEPGFIASVEFARRLTPRPPDHPQYVASYEEQVARLTGATLEDARRFHGEFYGPGAMQLAVVGDFDAAAVESLASELFADWRSPAAFEPILTGFRETVPVDTAFQTPDKANAFLIAGHAIRMTQDHEDYAALTLANFILGGGFLNSRLAVRIRQKEGLSYGVGSGFAAGVRDDNALFQGFAIFAPENVARLEAAFKEELQRAIRDGFTAEEVEAAKSGWLQQQQVLRSQDGGLAAALAANAYYDRTMAFQAGLERNVAALTAERLGEVMRRYIDPARLIIIKAGDFAKGPKT